MNFDPKGVSGSLGIVVDGVAEVLSIAKKTFSLANAESLEDAIKGVQANMKRCTGLLKELEL